MVVQSVLDLPFQIAECSALFTETLVVIGEFDDSLFC